ncbi:MAG TPA: SDR family NAD(P)-dependent oxidoreductase [Longimicrobium sp.]|nr:SDR family NAD(P)-dependent oxidoreductase [Longimicrobium sp.]
MSQTLQGRVAVVTGASRGAGRAIAAALGEAGATVYLTGRSARGDATTDGVPGTVDDAAEEVTARGGRGVAVRVDHAVDAEVAALFDRVRRDEGRLDLLVNNVWGGYEKATEGPSAKPFWTLDPADAWRGMFEAGVRAHLVASKHAVPPMLPRRAGLIVNTVAWAFGDYIGSVAYDTAKAAIIRMAFGMARELEPFGIAAVALAPGFMRTERVMAAHAKHPFDLSETESPEYLGRAVVALASDPAVIAKTGQNLTAGELAREYGFTDVDGTQPPPFRMPEGWLKEFQAGLVRAVEGETVSA